MGIQHLIEDDRGMSILLRYQGPAVDEGAMSVYDAAANMTAFSDFVVTAAKKVYGDRVKVTAEVTAYRHASFGTELYFCVEGAAAAAAAGLFALPAVSTIGTVITAVKEAIEVYKFLKGKKPEATDHMPGDLVRVTNNDGNIIIVHGGSVTLALDEKASAAAAQFAGVALSKEGINRMEISSDGTPIATATSREADYFRPIKDENVVSDFVHPATLIIEAVNFSEGKTWRMSDGSQTFACAMEDQAFANRIDDGEAFRKGDVLNCDVRVIQTKLGKTVKTHRSIVRVHHHESGATQTTFDLDD